MAEAARRMLLRLPTSRAMRLLALAMLLGAPHVAHAAGLVLAPPGVASLARAGATAVLLHNAEALGANPAGLGDAPGELRLGAGVAHFASTATRRPPGSAAFAPAVQGRPLHLPIPELGLVLATGGPRAPRLAVLLSADYPSAQTWPDARDDIETPQRYATVDVRGTALGRAALGAGWSPWPWLSVGAQLGATGGRIAGRSTLSLCDGVACVFPEDPAYDGQATLRSDLLIGLSGGGGIVVRPRPWLQLGASYQSGVRLGGEAEVGLQLPRAPLFAGAQVGPVRPRATLGLRLPATWRAGIAWTPTRRLGLELDVSHTGWSVHDGVSMQRIDLRVDELLAVGSFVARPLALGRRHRDVWAGHLALSGDVPLGPATLGLTLGGMLEPGAVRPEALSALAVDLSRALATAGVALRLGRAELQVSGACVAMRPRRVWRSTVRQQNPTRPPDSREVSTVGEGRYRGAARVLAAALSWAL